MTDRQRVTSPHTGVNLHKSGVEERYSQRYSRLNDRFGLFIAAVVLLAPVPLASNRPVWWLLWGLIIGTGSALHLALGTRIAPRRPLQLHHHLPLMLAGLGVAGFALLQALPLALLLPEALRSLPASAALSPLPRSISLAPDASLAGGLRVMIYLCFFALVLEVSSQPARAERIGWLLFMGIAAQAIWGLVALKFLGDTILLQDKPSYQGFATGTFINRNSYATFLGFGIVLGIALTLGRTLGRARTQAKAHAARIRPPRRSGVSGVVALETLGLWVLIGGMAITLVATQSRLGGAATALGAGLTFVILRAKAGLGGARIFLELLTGGAALGVVAFWLGGTGLMERSLGVEGDTAFRLELYHQLAGMIGARPLTGYGMDALAPAYELFRAPPVEDNRILYMGHNTYLTLWAELGVIAGSLPVLALALVAVALMRRVRQRETRLAMPAAAGGTLLLGAVHSLGDFSLEIPGNVFLFLALIGLGVAHNRAAGSPGPPPEHPAA